jgi:hypothetical protein
MESRLSVRKYTELLGEAERKDQERYARILTKKMEAEDENL